MFAEATQKAAQFTRPVVISMYTHAGVCRSSIGSFVILNREGWILTAWHILDLSNTLAKSMADCHAHDASVKSVADDPTLNPEARAAALAALGPGDPDWIRQYSLWWGIDGCSVTDVMGLPGADLAVGRLQPFDPSWVTEYPVLKDPAKPMLIGTGLCKLGYPFHSITPIFEHNQFRLPPGSVPPPLFPIEGIFTRQIAVGRMPEGFPLAYLETSSPGLRGQSGGPTYDARGTLWAIQSRTAHLALGFNPPVPGGTAGQVEHQFLNVGHGVHPATIKGALDQIGVSYTLSDY